MGWDWNWEGIEFTSLLFSQSTEYDQWVSSLRLHDLWSDVSDLLTTTYFVFFYLGRTWQNLPFLAFLSSFFAFLRCHDLCTKGKYTCLKSEFNGSLMIKVNGYHIFTQYIFTQIFSSHLFMKVKVKLWQLVSLTWSMSQANTFAVLTLTSNCK